VYEALQARIKELEDKVQWLMVRQAGADGRALEPLYTIAEVGDLARCCTETVKNYLKRLKLPPRYVAVGVRRRRIRVLWESEVLAILSARSSHWSKPSDWTAPRQRQGSKEAA
jgi:hypothetical protein